MFPCSLQFLAIPAVPLSYFEPNRCLQKANMLRGTPCFVLRTGHKDGEMVMFLCSCCVNLFDVLLQPGKASRDCRHYGRLAREAKRRGPVASTRRLGSMFPFLFPFFFVLALCLDMGGRWPLAGEEQE